MYDTTKLASDKLLVVANSMVGIGRTRFAVVRYGNVEGPRCSVLPFFQKLLAAGATRLPITDARVRRFWITLHQGVDFVLENFHRMHGCEIFMPKLPSIRVTDLATALALGLAHEHVSMRPGEKLHEVICPADTPPLALEFKDHYVIRPTIQFNMDDLRNAVDLTSATASRSRRASSATRAPTRTS